MKRRDRRWLCILVTWLTVTAWGCGSDDTSGATDTSGTSGATDTSGTSGATDTSGTSGATDTSDTSGATDTSGTSGATDTSDTSGATDTSDTSDAPDACDLSPGACAALGKVYNAAACRCDDPIGPIGDCAQVDDPCDADLIQPDGFTCIRLSQPDPFTGSTGICALACDGFFFNDCAPGQVCFPKELYGAERDVCVLEGALGEGEPCSGLFDPFTRGSRCLDGLLCLGGVCARPNCTPISDGISCAVANETCDGVTFNTSSGQVLQPDVGFCVQQCVPFSGASGCDAGEWCEPSLMRAGDAFTGSCIEGGAKAVGEACVGDGECVAGSICLASSAGQSSCERLCDGTLPLNSSAPGSCGAGQGCARLSGGDDVFDLGRCVDACGFDEGQSCADAADSCVPSEVGGLFNLSFDFCADFPSAANYTACTTAEFSFCNPLGICIDEPLTGYAGNVCQPLCRLALGALGATDHPDCGGAPGDFVCVNKFNTSVLPAGLCVPMDCDPEGASACGAGEACRSLTSDNPNAGRCQQTCDTETSPQVCAAQTQCISGELLGFLTGNANLEGDFCENQRPAQATRWPLTPGEGCAGAGLTSGDLCGPLAICLSNGGSVACTELCRVSEGALGSTMHPDCANPAHTCAATFSGPSPLGTCRAQ